MKYIPSIAFEEMSGSGSCRRPPGGQLGTAYDGAADEAAEVGITLDSQGN